MDCISFCFFISSLIFSCFLLNCLLKFFSFGHVKLPLPPGTMGWPYIGETFQLYSQNPNTFFASKVKKYGSIFKTHILGCRCVMISSPEAAKLVLVSKAHLFKPTFPASKERMLGKLAIFFHQGDYHTKLRKLVLRAFKPEAIKNIISDVESLAVGSLESWEGKLITTFQEMKICSQVTECNSARSICLSIDVCKGELVTVRVKSPNPDGHGDIEVMPIYEAVCRVCYANLIKEETNVLKTNCRCKFTLIHEKCVDEIANKNCVVCEEVTNYIPVTLSTEVQKPIDPRPRNLFQGLFRTKKG